MFLSNYYRSFFTNDVEKTYGFDSLYIMPLRPYAYKIKDWSRLIMPFLYFDIIT